MVLRDSGKLRERVRAAAESPRANTGVLPEAGMLGAPASGGTVGGGFLRRAETGPSAELGDELRTLSMSRREPSGSAGPRLF
jgi:hypothetical protein